MATTFDRPTQLTLFDRPTKPTVRTETEVPEATVEQILAQDRAGWSTATIAATWNLTEQQVIDVRYRDMMQRDLGPTDEQLDRIFGPLTPQDERNGD